MTVGKRASEQVSFPETEVDGVKGLMKRGLDEAWASESDLTHIKHCNAASDSSW